LVSRDNLHIAATPGTREIMSPPTAREICTKLAVLLAVVSGASVANIYYAQPLLDQIGHDLGIERAGLGPVTTATRHDHLPLIVRLPHSLIC
jgi:hypothetical protein